MMIPDPELEPKIKSNYRTYGSETCHVECPSCNLKGPNAYNKGSAIEDWNTLQKEIKNPVTTKKFMEFERVKVHYRASDVVASYSLMDHGKLVSTLVVYSDHFTLIGSPHNRSFSDIPGLTWSDFKTELLLEFPDKVLVDSGVFEPNKLMVLREAHIKRNMIHEKYDAMMHFAIQRERLVEMISPKEFQALLGKTSTQVTREYLMSIGVEVCSEEELREGGRNVEERPRNNRDTFQVPKGF